MTANDVLNELFKLHDEYSFDCVFNESDEIRQQMFYKAEALRELVQKLEESIKDQGEQNIFKDAIMGHYKSLSQGLFYNRRLRLKE